MVVFTASPAIYRDHSVLHFIKERYVAACFDCCPLFETFNEQYPSFVPENRFYHLGG